MEHNLTELLKYIDPATLDYQEWVNVGMALKEEGYTAFDWDSWSKNDTRYKLGECYKKWMTFNGTGTPVTGGTIYEYAKRGGYSPIIKEQGLGRAIGWDDVISDDVVVVDNAWLEAKDIKEPTDKAWKPVDEIITYLETLFEPNDYVGYVTSVFDDEGKFKPTKGNYDRTAGVLIEKLKNCNGDIGAVLGDYKKEAGAWIRFNPLDGKGVKNENVTAFKYALVESDKLDIGKQNAIIRELELPVACLVYSGGKSVHAIVKIEAENAVEYKKRVEYLYKICEKNSFIVDTQNKNPSRLTRLPGVVRGEKKQFLIDTDIGKSSWKEWVEWIEAVNDDLPQPEGLTDLWDDMPLLAPCLIDGVLRKGHKMLISGPSKAGKSFALIELTIAIAEGRKWLGFDCAKGRVLYVNLELDRASCLHRFKEVYTALGWEPEHLNNIDIWNLRGKSAPLDKLAPKLIRRSEKRNYTAVIIDPIYKVITGDENSADQMALFCNQFDVICTELKAAVIYCHHHSKGAQGGKKAMDRASGSGVFARDPDALIDIVELDLTESLKKNERGKAKIRGIEKALDKYVCDWKSEIGQDDRLSPSQMFDFAGGKLNWDEQDEMQKLIAEEEEKTVRRSAWRIEGILREFPSFKPVSVWFDYPIHKLDDIGVLDDLKTEAATKENFKNRLGNSQREKKKLKLSEFDKVFKEIAKNEEATVAEMAETMGVSEKSIKRYADDLKGSFVLKENVIKRI